MSINLNIYADIQRVITNPEYAKNKHLIVKEFGKVFIIKYDKIYLNINNINTLGLFRSIIVDEKANLLSFSPTKSYNLLNDWDNKLFRCLGVIEYLRVECGK